MHECIHVCMWCTHIHMSVCTCIYIYVCVYEVHIYIYAWTHIFLCLCDVHICAWVYNHLCICVDGKVQPGIVFLESCLLHFHFNKNIYLLGMSVFACMHLCAPHVCPVSEEMRGDAMRVLEAEPGSSATNTLDHWDFSPVPSWFLRSRISLDRWLTSEAGWALSSREPICIPNTGVRLYSALWIGSGEPLRSQCLQNKCFADCVIFLACFFIFKIKLLAEYCMIICSYHSPDFLLFSLLKFMDCLEQWW